MQALLLSLVALVPMVQDYPKLSPFSAIRWQGEVPEVEVGSAWFELVELAQQPAGKIVAFCKDTWRSRWQKRFEEDLVEVLTKLGREPKDRVDLEDLVPDAARPAASARPLRVRTVGRRAPEVGPGVTS